MEEPTVKDAQKALRELERDIGEMLAAYEQAYGAVVESVYIRSRGMRLDRVDTAVYLIEIEAKL